MGILRATTKKILSIPAHLIGLDRLINISGEHLIAPFYHLVSNDNPAHIKHLYPVVNTSLFRRSLDYYLKHYSPLSCQALLECVKQNRAIRENRFFLSFDDGFRECHDVIAPILLEKGIPATFFINSAFVDNKDLFFRLKASILMEQAIKKNLSPGEKKQIQLVFNNNQMSFHTPADLLLVTKEKEGMFDEIAPIVDIDLKAYLSDHRPYLTSQQINELIRKGFTIGSHSVSHPSYAQLPEDAQVAQTIDCLRFLNNKWNVSERFFSFPHTDHGVKPSFFERIKPDVDLSFGTAGLKPDPIPSHFQRIPMETGDCNPEKIIKTEYVYFLLKRLVGKEAIHRN